jgi:hypothetical protein
MPSTIQVTEKTVNNRDVISFSKEYSGEQHEVFAPKEHATQVMLDVLSIVNQPKEESQELVLARKGDLGGDIASVDGELLKASVVQSVVSELYDEQTASDVAHTLNGENDE